jgi:L-cysteine/cystine lyase
MTASFSDRTTTLLTQHRQQFPSLQNKIYFNYGGQGPMPEGAIAAMHAAQLKIQQDGPFCGAVNRWLQQEGSAMRSRLAAELNVAPEAMTLTEDVTVGCNIPLWGIDWQAGDRILLTDCEHPGIIAAVQEIRRRFGVELDFCPMLATAQGGDPIAVIAAHLQPRTRLLVVSHILWNTGQVLPLQEITQLCHNQPEPVGVLVDAAQSVGMMPLDLTALEVDFYAFTGHKWCCGPAGLGGLYVRPALRDRLAPTFIGWRGITVDGQGNPTGWQPNGQRYEVATSDYTLIAGLRSALEIHAQWGTPGDRYQRITTLSHGLWQRLQALASVRCITAQPPQSGLVSFQLLADGQPSIDLHTRLVKDMEAKGILLRTLLHPHCVRACVHYLTLETEIDRLLTAIQQWLS